MLLNVHHSPSGFGVQLEIPWNSQTLIFILHFPNPAAVLLNSSLSNLVGKASRCRTYTIVCEAREGLWWGLRRCCSWSVRNKSRKS